MLIVEYNESGAVWQEALYSAIQDWGPAGAGLWTNKDTFSVRTSDGTQEEIQRLDREIVEHRRRTNAEINNQMYHNLMGTDEYVNPHTKRVETGSNVWNYRWVKVNGEAIYTDDVNFDPERHGLRGFVKSPVRKRFPDR